MGSDVVVIVSPAPTLIDRFAVFVSAVGLLESVTVTVKLEVPTAVGLPVMAPVVSFSVSPAGRVPVVTVQLYGDVPPLAASVPL